jgi:hypothetical protein
MDKNDEAVRRMGDMIATIASVSGQLREQALSLNQSMALFVVEPLASS